MKSQFCTMVLSGWLAFWLAASALYSAELGMEAPDLAIQEWVKGTPVQIGGKGNTNIYVVEFWATWCGPCRISIPHLTEMQKKFKSQGVVFVGISSEEADAVKPFVQRMGDQMDYRVAIDKDQLTSQRYMMAFGAEGIPHAFVVNREGKIVWEGHPMSELEQTLEQLIAGKYDMRRILVQSQFLKDAQRYLMLVATVGATPESDRLGKQMLENAKDQPRLLRGLASFILSDGRLRHRDLKLALEAAQTASNATDHKQPVMLQTYAQALFDNGRQSEAVRIQKDAIALAKDPEEREILQNGLSEFEKRLAAEK